METRSLSVKSMSDIFREELKKHYDQREINQFLFLLLNHRKGWNRIQAYMNGEQLLSGNEMDFFREAIAKLKNRFPIQYITGNAFFYGLEFSINPDVLIPRPETEELVDMIINENKHLKTGPPSVLDIGTGSGCIAVALKYYLPGISVAAIDKSISALNVSRENAERHNCPVKFLQKDILNKTEWTDVASFDLIVSNPPYVLESEKQAMEQNVAGFEPQEALFVPDDDALKFYSAIAEFSLIHLTGTGRLYFEINEKFGQAIRTMLVNYGFAKAEIIKDLNGKDRFVRGELYIPADSG